MSVTYNFGMNQTGKKHGFYYPTGSTNISPTSEAKLFTGGSTSEGTLNFTGSFSPSGGGMGVKIFLVAAPILFILGMFCNTVSLVVLRRGALKKLSLCFYMSVLAVVDSGKC